jgi:hypothetical protein
MMNGFSTEVMNDQKIVIMQDFLTVVGPITPITLLTWDVAMALW